MQYPNGNTDAQSKKNYKKEKSRYNDRFLVATTLTPPIQHQKFSTTASPKATPLRRKQCISDDNARS
jgi:hypothetical protein